MNLTETAPRLSVVEPIGVPEKEFSDSPELSLDSAGASILIEEVGVGAAEPKELPGGEVYEFPSGKLRQPEPEPEEPPQPQLPSVQLALALHAVVGVLNLWRDSKVAKSKSGLPMLNLYERMTVYAPTQMLLEALHETATRKIKEAETAKCPQVLKTTVRLDIEEFHNRLYEARKENGRECTPEEERAIIEESRH